MVLRVHGMDEAGVRFPVGPLRRGGGIGRHAGFRSQWEQSRRSSNLLLGTERACPAEILMKAGRSIPVVRILREDVDWVRFPAART